MKFLSKDEYSGSELYLDEDTGQWTLSIESGDYRVEQLEGRNRLSLLLFLDSDTLSLDDLNSLLKIQDAKTSPFPWSKFVDIAFEQGSPHWITGALRWLEGLPVDAITRYHGDLKNVVGNKKRYGQKTRQLAFSLTRKIERSESH